MDAFYNQLLENNKEWVKSKIDSDPEFFMRLSKGQQPPVLWRCFCTPQYCQYGCPHRHEHAVCRGLRR